MDSTNDRGRVNRFYLKRFEIDGLNCHLSELPVDSDGFREQRIADILRFLAETDKRLQYETVQSTPHAARHLKKLSWRNTRDASLLLSGHRTYELAASQSDDFCTDFRFSIEDSFGKNVASDIDSRCPIFSNQGPILQSGFSIRIDLVSFSTPLEGMAPILARTARRKISWMSERNLILDL